MRTSFFKVLKECSSGSDWDNLSDDYGYSNEFIQKSNVLFDCIKKNKMFREAAYAIIKNFENEIGWLFFDTVENNLSYSPYSNHEKMFRDIEKIAITYALTLIKKERVNYYCYPTEKKLYKEKKQTRKNRNTNEKKNKSYRKTKIKFTK